MVIWNGRFIILPKFNQKAKFESDLCYGKGMEKRNQQECMRSA